MTTATLHLGDCLEYMRTMQDKSVDAVITDPPYGIADVWKGGASHGWGVASLATQKRNEWDVKPDKAVFQEILRIAEKVVIWGGNYFELPTSRGWLVWSKPERNFTLSEAELAWTNIPMPVRVFDFRRSDPDREHPTQKPVEVMKFSLEKAKLTEGATVFDPFMGSGTTGVACVQTGRNFIGCEIDPAYFAIAERRIRDAQAQPNLFEAQP
jgi:DNA modification methylase